MEEIRKYELDSDDFDNFKAAAQKWLDKFGLHEWEVDFTFETCDDNTTKFRLLSAYAKRRCMKFLSCFLTICGLCLALRLMPAIGNVLRWNGPIMR